MVSMVVAARALAVGRAFVELADEAITYGKLPQGMASGIAKEASETAASLRTALAHANPRLSPSARRFMEGCLIDLDALTQLAELIVKKGITPSNAAHYAPSVRYTAGVVIAAALALESALGESE